MAVSRGRHGRQFDQTRGGRNSLPARVGRWGADSSTIRLPTHGGADRSEANGSTQGTLATLHRAQPPGHGQAGPEGFTGQHGQGEAGGPSGEFAQAGLVEAQGPSAESGTMVSSG